MTDTTEAPERGAAIADLLDHLQVAVAKGEPHGAIAYKVQNIRAAYQRAIPALIAEAVEAAATRVAEMWPLEGRARLGEVLDAIRSHTGGQSDG